MTTLSKIDDADKVDGKTTGLSDDNVCLLPSATIGQILQRGASAWAAGDVVPDFILLKAKDGWPSTTSGCAAVAAVESGTYKVNQQVMAFDKDSDEYAEWETIMPYNGTFTATFIWSCASGVGNTAATVQWACQARSYGNDDAIDQDWGTAQSIGDTWIADEDVHITAATSAITPAGTPAAGELLQIRVYRDVSDDDLGGDARLLAVLLTFTRS